MAGVAARAQPLLYHAKALVAVYSSGWARPHRRELQPVILSAAKDLAGPSADPSLRSG